LTSEEAVVSTPPSPASATVPGVTFLGLPVIGFAARRSSNGFFLNAGTLVRSTLTATAPHKFEDGVSP
jgi:hypothetical protein